MTAQQARAARAFLGLSTRHVAKAIGVSPMAISKLENGKIFPKCWLALLNFYHSQGIAFYAEGVIPSPSRIVQDYAEPLRQRLMDGQSGSAYVAAFDRIIKMAAQFEQAICPQIDKSLIEEIEDQWGREAGGHYDA